MNVTAIPLTEFVHGPITAHEGKPLTMDEAMAAELERAGLVRIRLEPVPAKKEVPGKAQDDGAGQPSSASPAAPASPPQTLHLPKHGDAKPRKKEK